MAMNELRKEVEAAAMAELNRANAKFPLFNSTHEGYAVILEEAEGAQEAMENVKTSLAVLWDRVKGIEVACFLDEDTTPTAIFHQAIDAACEMVQTAAMLLKYEMSLGGTGRRERRKHTWRFMRLILTAHWQLPGSRKSWSRNGR